MTNLTARLQDLKTKRDSEDGFTLIELMIVVVIIGILAAIAIPIFMNQQEAAIQATVKSEVKSAASEAALTAKPATKQTSNGNTIETIVNSGIQDYIIRGSNPALPDYTLCFTSLTGLLTECASEAGPGGPSGPGPDWDAICSSMGGTANATGDGCDYDATPPAPETCQEGWIATAGGGCMAEYSRSLLWDRDAIDAAHPDFEGSYNDTFGCNSPFILGVEWWQYDEYGQGISQNAPANPDLYFTTGCANWD